MNLTTSACSGEPVVTPCKEDKNLLSSAPARVQKVLRHCTHQTSQQVTTSSRSKLCCGSENNSNLTAVMSGLPSSQHAQDLTELCSSKDAIITRTLGESRCVEKSSRKEGSSVTPPHAAALVSDIEQLCCSCLI